MSTIWMITGGFLIVLSLAGFLTTVLFERVAVRKLQRKYAEIFTSQYADDME